MNGQRQAPYETTDLTGLEKVINTHRDLIYSNWYIGVSNIINLAKRSKYTVTTWAMVWFIDLYTIFITGFVLNIVENETTSQLDLTAWSIFCHGIKHNKWSFVSSHSCHISIIPQDYTVLNNWQLCSLFDSLLRWTSKKHQSWASLALC